MKECLELNIKAKREVVEIVVDPEVQSKKYWLDMSEHFIKHGMPGMAKLCVNLSKDFPEDD